MSNEFLLVDGPFYQKTTCIIGCLLFLLTDRLSPTGSSTVLLEGESSFGNGHHLFGARGRRAQCVYVKTAPRKICVHENNFKENLHTGK